MGAFRGDDEGRLIPDKTLPCISEGILIIRNVPIEVEVHREVDGSIWGHPKHIAGVMAYGKSMNAFLDDLRRQVVAIHPELKGARRADAVIGFLEKGGLLLIAVISLVMIFLGVRAGWSQTWAWAGTQIFAVAAGARLGIWFTRRHVQWTR
jgi:hypothetical protein